MYCQDKSCPFSSLYTLLLPPFLNRLTDRISHFLKSTRDFFSKKILSRYQTAGAAPLNGPVIQIGFSNFFSTPLSYGTLRFYLQNWSNAESLNRWVKTENHFSKSRIMCCIKDVWPFVDLYFFILRKMLFITNNNSLVDYK